jgi:nitrogenase iron protein NifH
VPRDRIVNVAENRRQTVLQFAPDCGQADIYKELAETIWNNTQLTIPTPLAFEELEELAAHFGTETK